MCLWISSEVFRENFRKTSVLNQLLQASSNHGS